MLRSIKTLILGSLLACIGFAQVPAPTWRIGADGVLRPSAGRSADPSQKMLRSIGHRNGVNSC